MLYNWTSDGNSLPKVVTSASNSYNNVTPSVYQRPIATPLRTERNLNQNNTPSNPNIPFKASSSDNDTALVRHSGVVISFKKKLNKI